MTELPIHAVLAGPAAPRCATARSAVLVAPPGAGKTTAVAPALLGEPWCTGEILLLSPRRLAARAAAERMAELAGETVGETIGYATRLDSKRSARDPDPRPHRRHLPEPDPGRSGAGRASRPCCSTRCTSAASTAISASRSRSTRRARCGPTSGCVAMSATLDGARFAALMGGAPVIESEGRSHPIELRPSRPRAGEADRGRDGGRDPPRARRGGGRACSPSCPASPRSSAPPSGSTGLPADVDLHRLHGSLDPAAQRAAIAAAAAGPAQARPRHLDRRDQPDARRRPDRRRFRPRPAAALRSRRRPHPPGHRARQPGRRHPARRPRRRARGRASSIGCGRKRRRRACRASTRPKSWRRTCRALLLDCALWGVADPRALRMARSAARRRGRRGAHAGCTRSARSARTAGRPPTAGPSPALPLPPRLAHMLIEAEARGWGRTAAEVAVLLSERGLGGNDADLETAAAALAGRDGAKRAEAARGLARRWLQRCLSRTRRRRSGQARGDDSAPASPSPSPTASRSAATATAQTGSASAAAASGSIPPRRSRAKPGWRWRRSAEPPPGARILSAAPIDQADGRGAVRRPDRDRRRSCASIPPTGTVRARHGRRLGAITLVRRPGQPRRPGRDRGRPCSKACASTASTCCRGATAPRRCAAAPPSPASYDPGARRPFRRGAARRASTTGCPCSLAGKRRPRATSTRRALTGDARRRCSAGRAARRSTGSPPAISRPRPAAAMPSTMRPRPGRPSPSRVQALFGLADHPDGGRRPGAARAGLTSPAGRPIQTTRDLPGFWSGSWAAVAKEMRGRYPKHPWPDDPAAADPTLRTKKATGPARDRRRAREAGFADMSRE